MRWTKFPGPTGAEVWTTTSPLPFAPLLARLTFVQVPMSMLGSSLQLNV